MNPAYSKRLDLFPITSRINQVQNQLRLSINGIDLVDLANEYGTPLYVFDRATLDDAVDQYLGTLAANYPGTSGITYAGKAFLCLAIAQWTQHRKIWLDCTGIGEMAVAQAAGVSRESILVHGVNKSWVDIATALDAAGTLVIDNLMELERVIQLSSVNPDRLPRLWLRLRPGMAVETHTYTQTGQGDSKFGMSPAEVAEAVKRCMETKLPLTGLHFHLGSHFHDPTPLETAILATFDLIDRLRAETGWYPQNLCTGGGWGIPYHEDELPYASLAGYIELICKTILNACSQRDLPLPHLQVEPGRSLIARGCVSIYQIGAIKRTASRKWLLLDGGMADNIRPALYRARYSALPLVGLDRSLDEPVWLAGPYCESADILVESLPMPAVEAGEYVALPASGAYHLSMASNYNGARKPAVLWLDQDRAYLIQRRETLADLYRRDIPLDTITN